MPSLKNLPPELLLAIADHLAEERDIYTLLRVNRRFSGVFLNFLYWHNIIHHDFSALIWGLKHKNEDVVRRAHVQQIRVECIQNQRYGRIVEDFLSRDCMCTSMWSAHSVEAGIPQAYTPSVILLRRLLL
ncbi:unnamed protein product [Penicillium manginii]